MSVEENVGFPQHLQETALEALSLMDLTSLNDADTDASIQAMLAKGLAAPVLPAAVCVYPHFVSLCLEQLKQTPVRVATVANFPIGAPDPDAAAREVADAVALGAHEVDVVFPYAAFLAGELPVCRDFMAECKAAIGDAAVLKVIIESGVLKDAGVIRLVSDICLDGGADFIKTSTGKTKVSASPGAATAMLEAIKDHGGTAGFKASGGIRSVSQAWQYLNIARKIMGEDWVTPQTFRFGASGLLDDILLVLGLAGSFDQSAGY